MQFSCGKQTRMPRLLIEGGGSINIVTVLQFRRRTCSCVSSGVSCHSHWEFSLAHL